MQSAAQTAPVSKNALVAGRIVSGLVSLFLLFDAIGKLMRANVVLQAFDQLGYQPSVSIGIGTVLLICVALYLIPRTSILGAILLTGYLGGAVATHVRVGNPLFSHALFPVYLGILIWGGLFLREQRLRALVPLRS
jgi:DoxX-like family